MPGNVKLRFGDLFDGPADLIVLPCSTGGSVTQLVAARLHEHGLTFPPRRLELGQIHVEPFTGGDHIAQYYAFAATVHRASSCPEAIRSIARLLGDYTARNCSVRSIAAPLLGTSAGRLAGEVSADELCAGFLESADPNATLAISVLKREVFDRILERHPKKPPAKPLRVFISYTRSSDDHALWVENLGKFLRSHGIESRLDCWHLRTGMDMPQWMCNEMDLADKVIIVTDEKYAEKADGRMGGVGWETMLIQGDLAKQPHKVKYLIVVRSDDFDAGLPMYLKTKFAIHWHPKVNEGQLRECLLKELFDVQAAPPIGVPPVFIA